MSDKLEKLEKTVAELQKVVEAQKPKPRSTTSK